MWKALPGRESTMKDMRAKKRWFFLSISLFLLSIAVSCAGNDRPLIKDNRSAWFLSRYNKDVPLFMEPQTIHPEGDKAGMHFPAPADILPRRQGIVSCAVVGSSGNLKGAGFGPEIDNHTSVFRMNKAPTKGYENDVGSKTTFRIGIFPPHRMPDLLEGEPDSILINYLDSYKKHEQKTKSLVDVQKRLLILHPAFLSYINDAWEPHPSTGMRTLILAIHLCDKVTAYGFGANKAGEWDHYYENRVSLQSTSIHDFSEEEAMRNRMESEKLIQVRYP
jgi:hypothetical protein